MKDFNIVVAQLEGAVGDSLHDMIAELNEKVPAAADYSRSLISATSCAQACAPVAVLTDHHLGLIRVFGSNCGGSNGQLDQASVLYCATQQPTGNLEKQRQPYHGCYQKQDGHNPT